MGRKDKPIFDESSGSPNIGQRMRQFRQAKGLSLTKMSEDIGYSISYLSGVENGYVLPSPGLIKEYERALQLKVDELEHTIRAVQSLAPSRVIPNHHSLDLLKRGVSIWNGWREEHIEEHPSLIGA